MTGQAINPKLMWHGIMKYDINISFGNIILA